MWQRRSFTPTSRLVRRPRLEVLEDRTMPAAFSLNPVAVVASAAPAAVKALVSETVPALNQSAHAAGLKADAETSAGKSAKDDAGDSAKGLALGHSKEDVSHGKAKTVSVAPTSALASQRTK